MIVILLLSLIYTILAIYLLKIKDYSYQMMLFSIVFILFYLSHYLLHKSHKNNKINTFNKNVPENENNLKDETPNIELSKEKLKILKEECKNIYSNDNIIPHSVYNPRDCTNDNSCIIPPSVENSFAFVQDNLSCKVINSYKSKNSIKNNNEIKNCIKCGRELSLLNNPTDQSFMSKCNDKYDKCAGPITPSLDTSIELNNMCVHCKVGLMLNRRCFDINDIPKEYYNNKLN